MSGRDGGAVKFVRLLWCDAAGVTRARVVPVEQWKGVIEGGVGLTRACMAFASWCDVPAPWSGLQPVGEIRLKPPQPLWRRLPWRPSHAATMAEMVDENGESWSCCPRAALSRMLELAEKECGLTFRIGFEHEFVLLHPGEQPIDDSRYCSASAFDAAADVLDDMVSTLQAMGIGVVQLHAESGGGQFEIATAADEPMAAADALVIAREAICAIARTHRMIAHFAPKFQFSHHSAATRNGCHCHISIWKDGVNVLAPGSTVNGFEHAIGSQFITGVVRHMAAIAAMTLATPASFERVVPDSWTGAYRMWGVENKEAPLRLCQQHSATDANIEFKCFDATTNPYIGVAAIIAAGLLGIRRREWYEALKPVNSNPSSMTADQLRHLKIERLPTDLHAALCCMRDDAPYHAVLAEGIGEQLLKVVIAVRHHEIGEEFCDDTIAEHSTASGTQHAASQSNVVTTSAAAIDPAAAAAAAQAALQPPRAVP